MVRELVGTEVVGVVIIDGAHTYQNSLEDFDLYWVRLPWSDARLTDLVRLTPS